MSSYCRIYELMRCISLVSIACFFRLFYNFIRSCQRPLMDLTAFSLRLASPSFQAPHVSHGPGVLLPAKYKEVADAKQKHDSKDQRRLPGRNMSAIQFSHEECMPHYLPSSSKRRSGLVVVSVEGRRSQRAGIGMRLLVSSPPGPHVSPC